MQSTLNCTPCFLQQPRGGLNAIEHGAASAVMAVHVMELFGAVDAESDQDVVLGEEGGPLVIQQDAVGLDRALDLPTRRKRLFFGLKRPAKNSSPISVGSPPCHASVTYGGCSCREVCERTPRGSRRTCGTAVRVEIGVLEVEAVVAAQVAARPGGLGHHMECGHGRFAHAAHRTRSEGSTAFCAASSSPRRALPL